MKNYTIRVFPASADTAYRLNGILSMCEYISDFDNQVNSICIQIAKSCNLTFKRYGNVLEFTKAFDVSDNVMILASSEV